MIETICECGKEKAWDEELCQECFEKQNDRKGFIGGSDIAGIMGLSRWRTPLSVWAEKTGKVKAKDLSDNEAVELGSELEDFVAKKFERKTGMKVRRAPQRYFLKSNPVFRCQVDRLIQGTDELLEVKTCSAWKEKEWEGEEIPIEYILQTMWQLLITGRKVGHIAVLIGGQKFRYKKIEADQEMFDKMVKAAAEFWSMVQNNIPPLVMGMDNPFMVELYPEDNEKMQQVEELNDRIALLMQTKGNIKAMYEEQDKLEAEIKAVIGDTLGVKTKEYVVTWRGQMSSRVDIEKLKEDSLYEKYLKQTQTRVLRVKSNKGNDNANGQT